MEPVYKRIATGRVHFKRGAPIANNAVPYVQKRCRNYLNTRLYCIHLFAKKTVPKEMNCVQYSTVQHGTQLYAQCISEGG